jgi:transcriptional regulator with XRE-family HTH domain
MMDRGAPARLLREVRNRSGFTQGDLAKLAQTSQTAISRLERGRVSPTVFMLAMLLEILGEDLELGTRPNDAAFAASLSKLADPQRAELVRTRRALARWEFEAEELEAEVTRVLGGDVEVSHLRVPTGTRLRELIERWPDVAS